MHHGGEREPLGELGSGEDLVVVREGLQDPLVPLIRQDFKRRIIIAVKDVPLKKGVELHW